jgi:hypothetical protein
MINSMLELRVRLRDALGLTYPDRGAERTITEMLDWIGRAQDLSAIRDGGVARHFSIKKGWATSYPETTGYIVTTMLDGRYDPNAADSRRRGIAMLDWLVSIQFPEGGFRGGIIGQEPVVPVTFNTGQILIGLASGAELNPSYKEAMHKAARWLVETQDADGCWRRFATPFAKKDEKTYETHVSLGLFGAHNVDPMRGYQAAGLKQVDWALTNQAANGWLDKCCLDDPADPYTHTLGYALRGIVGAYESSGQQKYLDAAVKTADALLAQQQPDGKLFGRFDKNWKPTVGWVCLTGLSQISESWLMLSRMANRPDYLAAGRKANAFVRRSIAPTGHDGIRGGVKGSLPVSGHYGKWQYLNWAAKFTIDANRAELALS